MSGGARNNDESLIAYLASGLSWAACAKLTGMAKSTIARRCRKPAFRKRVRAAREIYLQQLLGTLARGSVEGAGELRKLLKDSDARIRLQSAKALVDAEHRFLEAEDLRQAQEELDERIKKLEQVKKGRSKRGPYS
jgi:hypothetical protein